jgi:hypothetical protein
MVMRYHAIFVGRLYVSVLLPHHLLHVKNAKNHRVYAKNQNQNLAINVGMHPADVKG